MTRLKHKYPFFPKKKQGKGKKTVIYIKYFGKKSGKVNNLFTKPTHFIVNIYREILFIF